MKRTVSLVIVLLIAFVVIYLVEHTKAQSGFPKELSVEKMDVQDEFNGKKGTFILRDLENNKTLIYNKKRASSRQAPIGTFQIPSSLIALETKTVKDEYEVKRWNGSDQGVDEWNKDLTLASSLRSSAPWYEKEIVQDIGVDNINKWLQRLNYGNEKTEQNHLFWEDNSLQISPLEQANFLESLYHEDLPFSSSSMKKVKRIMIEKETGTYTLHSVKGSKGEHKSGWYIGFVTVKGHPYVFVTNIEGSGKSDESAQAKKITEKIFKKYDVLKGASL
ncbi:class D beta-lactamase [Priestia filamentosa]|uniref:penicillin-binding transpeptidase domain-containing protein n=1 Tax=Priestia filamentosa TaxID=1402861 RepID=UPI001FB1D34B|nr:penicillin-binding transpeptidase domain-containing protein [Priestia filamentosa]MED3726717.1 penicillin-binding transpeptidase domain-containing protein [Priestia filamentosa]UOE60084.1 class D beta-lactamase [Priestia filamentosa]